ncbi:MAG: hypothetical protein Q9216_003552 [Gyalolechia sp. 2 TL-2023]
MVLEQDQRLRDHPTTWQQTQPDARHVFAPQTVRQAIPSSFMSWASPPLGPPSMITPPLSSKSITPHAPQNHAAELDFARIPRSRGSSQKIFYHYCNPKAEDKAKDRLKRTCMSCYNKTNRKVLMRFGCSLVMDHDVNYPPLVQSQAPLPTTLSSCYLDTQSVLDSRGLSTVIPQLDEVLGGDACSKQRPSNSKRSEEEVHRESLQTGCRRLCTLFHVISHPEGNIIKYTTEEIEKMPDLVCMVLRQLCHKTTMLWEGVFEDLRSWVFGPRAKTEYSKNKAAVATSLAQLLRSVEVYDKAFHVWTNKGCPMPELTCGIATLSSYLEFIGQGVDMKIFDLEHRKGATTTSAVHLSTILPTTPTLMQSSNESTFCDILAPAGSYDISPEVSSHSHFANVLKADCLQKGKRVSNHHEDPQAEPLVGLECHHSLLPPQTATKSPMEPWATEDLRAFINRAPDPVQEEECRLQAQAELMQLQKRHNDMKEALHAMEERIYTIQDALGIDHTHQGNIFDEIFHTTQAVGGEADSPGAKTLVGAEDDTVFDPSISGQQSSDMPNSLHAGLGRDDIDTDDIVMGESVTLAPSQNSHQKGWDEVRKRKRFSRHSTSKKVRVDSKVQEKTDPSSNRATTIRSTKLGLLHDDFTSRDLRLDDDTKPPTTTRPISWPHNHRYRKSAGISVRKLTEVFEKICLQQGKA